MNRGVSPSRTYIAMCNKTNFDGYYFRKFTLPERLREEPQDAEPMENSSVSASWYFLNRLNFVACIEECFPAEDLGSAADLVEMELTHAEKMAKAEAETARMKESSRLSDGMIPAGTVCPFKDRCSMADGCCHRGSRHEVAFSCAAARGFDMIR